MSISASPVYAANECGVAANGATVICNNDGSPVSDSAPYAAGITYTNYVNLVVDGTVNPINMTGRIGVASGGGPQSTTVLGAVNMNITNPASGVAAIGDVTAPTRNIALDIGSDVNVNMTSTTARNLYAIAAHATNAAINVVSDADVNISTNVGSAARGYTLSDTVGGANSVVNGDIGGNINITSNNGSNIYGIFASITGVGGLQGVHVNSSANIDLTTTGTVTGSLMGIVAQNTGGDVTLTSSGEVNITTEGANLVRALVATSTLATGNTYVDVLNSVTVQSSNASAYSVYAAGANENYVNIMADITTIGSNSSAYGVSTSGTARYAEINIGSDVNITTSGNDTNMTVTPVGVWIRSTQGGKIDVGANSTVSTTSAAGASSPFGLAIGAGPYEFNIGTNALIEAISYGSSNAVAMTVLEASTAGGTTMIAAGAEVRAESATGIAHAFSGSNGVDDFTSYGDITGLIRMKDGNDKIRLLGGSLDGGIEMGADDDTLDIADFSAADLEKITHLDGGMGYDELTFTNIDYMGGTLASNDLSLGINLGNNWETINLVNSNWHLTGDLVLGGSTLNIDSTSTLYGGNGTNQVISSVIPGDPAIVNNAGVIDLTGGASGATDTLTILGDYVGQGGVILMNVATNGIGFQSDRLIVDGSNGGGTISGTSVITIVNTEVLGSATTGNGILLVQTVNGATTDDNAFVLSNPYIAAGAYSYTLNVNSGNQNWYLVSGAGARDAIVVDTAVPDLAHRMGLAMLGRRDSRVMDESGRFWMNAFGQVGSVGKTSNMASHGPAYDYGLSGVQIGMDLGKTPAAEKIQKSYGVFTSAAKAHASAFDTGAKAGRADMSGYGAGAYWDYNHNDQWYVDAAVQGVWYDNVRTRSTVGERLNTYGKGVSASLEGGINQQVSDDLKIVHQGQLVMQTLSLKNARDSSGRIDYGPANAVYAKVGPKVVKSFRREDDAYEVWVQPSLLHAFGAKAKTTVTDLSGANPANFYTDLGGSAGQLSLGFSAKINDNIALEASTDYTASFNRPGNSIGGRVGIKITW